MAIEKTEKSVEQVNKTPKPVKTTKSEKSVKSEVGKEVPTVSSSPVQEEKASAERPRAKRSKKQIFEGLVHIHATFNNTKIVITDLQGNVLIWSSASKAGFKGSRKSTPFAAQVAANAIVKEAIERFGLKQAQIKVNGPGSGRESAVRAIESAGLKVLSIEDVTGIPHNGCRDPKKRRV